MCNWKCNRKDHALIGRHFPDFVEWFDSCGGSDGNDENHKQTAFKGSLANAPGNVFLRK